MADKEKLGEKIRLIREKHGMSQENLAERSGIDLELIRRIEEGDAYPFLSTLVKIARSLGVRLGTFLDDQEQMGPAVTRAGSLKEVQRFSGGEGKDHKGMFFYSMALNKAGRHMEPFVVDILPGSPVKTDLSTHEGEEFIYVLSGKVEVTYGSDTFMLEEGDSIYYDSIVTHDIRSAGDSPARILAAIYAPY